MAQVTLKIAVPKERINKAHDAISSLVWLAKIGVIKDANALDFGPLGRFLAEGVSVIPQTN